MRYDDDDRDAPQDIDLIDDGDEPTVRCPACGREVHEDAALCPGCGEWMDARGSEAHRRSQGWFWPGMVGLLIGVILVMWMGLRR